MNRFNRDTWFLKCQFAAFSLKSQNTKPYPQLNNNFYPYSYCCVKPNSQIPAGRNITVLIQAYW